MKTSRRTFVRGLLATTALISTGASLICDEYTLITMPGAHESKEPWILIDDTPGTYQYLGNGPFGCWVAGT